MRYPSIACSEVLITEYDMSIAPQILCALVATKDSWNLISYLDIV